MTGTDDMRLGKTFFNGRLRVEFNVLWYLHMPLACMLWRHRKYARELSKKGYTSGVHTCGHVVEANPMPKITRGDIPCWCGGTWEKKISVVHSTDCPLY